VLLSAPGAEYEGHPLRPAEKAVHGSGVEWAILRPHWFAQNFSEDSWRPGILSGNLLLPTGEGRTPFIDAETYLEQQVAVGVPRAVAQILTGLFTGIRNGQAATVADGVEQALGRPPRPFEDYVAAATAAAAWN
jgi:uncharacterized protein YbjT (DUF2867 family)